MSKFENMNRSEKRSSRLLALQLMYAYEINKIRGRKSFFDATGLNISIYKIRLNLFKEFYRVLKKGGWITAQMGYGKGKLGAVPYHRDNHNAGRRNGRTDVYVEDPSQLEMDLRNVGFTDFQYWIREPGPGDAHPNWIFFRAKK